VTRLHRLKECVVLCFWIAAALLQLVANVAKMLGLPFVRPFELLKLSATPVERQQHEAIWVEIALCHFLGEFVIDIVGKLRQLPLAGYLLHTFPANCRHYRVGLVTRIVMSPCARSRGLVPA
jgi:hypothetical protein